MRPLLPFRPLFLRSYHSKTAAPTATAMAETTNNPNKTSNRTNNNNLNQRINNRNNKKKGQRWSSRPPKPSLTHFLCIPLVNAVSLPQLESSLATFKETIAQLPPESKERDVRAQDDNERSEPRIPDDAIRPVGTLHFTFGVMSLPTQERLDEALQFFRSLDLVALMREAEDDANKRIVGEAKRRELHNNPEEGYSTFPKDPVEAASKGEPSQAESTAPTPFTISLEGLRPLPPKANLARVLYALPVDSTMRLHTFCRALQNKFLEAGFLVGEHSDSGPKAQKIQATIPEIEQQQPAPDQPTPFEAKTSSTSTAEAAPLPEEVPTEVAKPDSGPEFKSQSKAQSKHRPLLLHATVVNTIYMKKKRGGNRHGIWAKDILQHFNQYYTNSERTIPRIRDGVAAPGDSEPGSGSRSEDKGRHDSYPFLWAREFPLETVSICEMGAKKLDPSADESEMNARLGHKYMAVEERSLDFTKPEARGAEEGLTNERITRDGSEVSGRYT
ncbi:AKAP7 2'5' RNA ligase-like domain-containing protein [Aspergillus filifer]